MSTLTITKDLVEIFINKAKEAGVYKTSREQVYDGLNSFRIEDGNIIGHASHRYYRDTYGYRTQPKITLTKAISMFNIDMPIDTECPCAFCGENAENGIILDDFDVCESCTDNYTSVCEDCEERCYSSDVTYLPGVDREVCCNCRDSYIRCGHCGDWFYADDISWNDYADEYQCSDCWENDNGNIYDYGYKPYPNFSATENDADDPRYFGIELEIGRGGYDGDYARELCNIMDDGDESYIYCKSDCSINEGFENVTHPCTLKYHMSMPWDEWTERAKKLGYREGYNCGLHIHVNRDSLGNTHDEKEQTIGNLICLIEKFWDNVVTFSRRDEDRIDEWAARYGAEAYPKKKGKKTAEYATDINERYHAINLRNSNTIEFRIFANTLNANTLFAALQFCDVACEWAKSASEDDVDDVEFKDVFYRKYFELDEELETLNLV